MTDLEDRAEPVSDPADLDFSEAAMREMGEAVVHRAARHLASLSETPCAGDVDAAALCRELRAPAPEAGRALEPILDELFERLVPRSFGTPHPGHLAFIPGGGVYPAALADFIADTTNRYTGVWQAAPALVQLEANALDWLRELMLFPESARGLFTTGASMAIANAIACAREQRLGVDVRRGTLYVSEEAHHSITKAARFVGIAHDRVRLIPSDERFRMRLDALEAAILDDRRAGLEPFMVFSTAGTTNTGAVDPLDAVADLAAREGLWHHVDGAYGGFFHAVPELRPLLAGLSRADSLTLDPHKGLFLPYGTGALLVRDGELLRALHGATAGYLPESQLEFYDPSQYGPDLSRGFPGLRVWLSFQIFGLARYRAAIAEKRALALWAAEEVRRIPGVVLDAPPDLSLFAFHLEGPRLASRAAEDEATHALVERVNARGRVMLSGAMSHGRFLARVCVLSFRTRRRDVEYAVEDLRDAARAILAGA